MCYHTYGSHLLHMTNDIKLDLKGKDLPVTALAYQSPSLLGLILGFTTLWAVMLFGASILQTGMKNSKDVYDRSSKYREVYSQELDRCRLENPYNDTVVYGLTGEVVKRYPRVDCFALARYTVKAKYGLSSQ
jgi:hypothetical protein